MSIPVSSSFTAAELADIAQVAVQVFVVRGDYASSALGGTATATDSDASGNFPPSGGINGDHTEINIGGPSVADNGIGLASWRSASTPSGGSPSTYTVAFNATRTFNFVKLYNLSTDPMTAYTLQYYNGSSWVTFATYSAANRVNGGLDTYDFSGIGTTFTGTKIQAVITGTTNSDAANIVELEVYFKDDVTSRCTSVKTDRQRDWKQVNPMAATANMVFDNSDSFFSQSYSPTAAQIAAGFFNSEIDAGLGIIVKMGFWYQTPPYYVPTFGGSGYGDGPYGGSGYGGGPDSSGSTSAPEMVTVFTGTVSSWKPSSMAGTCTIQATDGMKALLNQTWSTRLKYNIDTGLAIQYILNICNVSNYEMVVPITGLVQPYFFVYEASAFTTIQDLVESIGNAQFWFDENGIAQCVDLVESAGNSHTDYVFSSLPTGAYTVVTNTGSLVFNGSTLTLNAATGLSSLVTVYWSTAEANFWQWTSSMSGAQDSGAVQFASAGTTLAFTGSSTSNGYQLLFSPGGGGDAVQFCKTVSGTNTTLTAYAGPLTSTTWTVIRVVISGTTYWFIYANGVLVMNTTDSSVSSFGYFLAGQSGSASSPGKLVLSNINVLSSALAMSATSIGGGAYSLIFTSGVIDQTAAVASEGNMSVGIAPNNAPITFQTQTSPDNSMWTGYSNVTINTATLQGAIPSTTQRYIQYQFYFTISSAFPLWGLYYASVDWNFSVASANVRQLRYDSNLCDVEEELSDSLSGDSSILNYFEVISSPLILTGATTDVQWNGTAGYPPANISASNPMIVAVGTTTLQPIIQGGMDISFMNTFVNHGPSGSSGTYPDAMAITFGTAVGYATISYIHPTKPIITLVITTAGTITNLQLIGQSFSSSGTSIDIIVGDATSQQKYDRRTTQISNNYIPNPAVATLLANTQLALYKNPSQVITGPEVLLTPSIQLSDSAQFTDQNTGLSTSQTWSLSGVTHEVTVSDKDSATITTSVKAVQLAH